MAPITDGAAPRLQNLPPTSLSWTALGARPFAVNHGHLPEAVAENIYRASCIKDERQGRAAQARAWQEEAKRFFENSESLREAEKIYNIAIKRTLEKTEALEKHVKTGTMRAESLAATEADFFQTLLVRQEETQRDINELFA